VVPLQLESNEIFALVDLLFSNFPLSNFFCIDVTMKTREILAANL